MARRVSIKDVAREAGVSVTTVSHALNDKGRLREETRRRVRAVADRMGYLPNPAAQSLVSGRAGLIAVTASLPDDPRIEFSDFGYYTPMIGAATGAAVARDVALVVAPPTRAGYVWDRVTLDGVIVIDPVLGDPALRLLREQAIPFVTVGRDPRGHEGDAVVASDDVGGTRAMLDHLAEGGRPVGLLALPAVNAFLRDTVDGYRAWCEDRGQAQLLETLDLDELIEEEERTLERAIDRLLARLAPPAAIYVPIEIVGVAVQRVLLARGTRPGRDLGLATTYDAGRAASADPPITTLDFDYRELGTRAATMLLDLVNGERSAPQLEVVATHITPRASSVG